MDALDSLRIESALSKGAEEAKDETGQTDFLRMLVTQLENQDPLNPQDSANFAAQLAQFSQVEQLISVREGIDALVAASKAGQDGAGGPARAVDPTGLIGREVVVSGNVVEAGAEPGLVGVGFRTQDPAYSVGVKVVDAAGNTVHRESLLEQDGSGSPLALLPGDHVYRFDPTEQGLAPGVYSVQIEALDAGGRSLDVGTRVSGLVTGAILDGTPSVRLGGRVFPVDDVLEVRMPGGSAG